jgi:hypothetical protein
VRPGEHHLELAIVEGGLEGHDRRRELGLDRFPFAGQIGADLRLLDLLLQGALRLDLEREPVALSEGFLGLRGVVPEVRVGGLLVEGLEPGTGFRQLKDDLGARRDAP